LPAGDYSVRLAFKLNLDLLGESYQQAHRRFLSLERKLDRRSAAFIKEYLDLGHMSLVSAADIGSCRYFLPHHCVLKEDISTTKLRIVLNETTGSLSRYSLNDVLMAGPVIQHKRFLVLLRFRSHPVAIKRDIGQIFLCVGACKEVSYLQCVLWRDSPQGELRVVKLDTVSYFTKSKIVQY